MGGSEFGYDTIAKLGWLLRLPLVCPALGSATGKHSLHRSSGHACSFDPHGWLSLQTVEHGFPHQPSALGYSPSLRILAIGTRSGAIKLYPFHLVLPGS